MILSDYKIIFDIQFSHTYFKNNICDCLTYSPGKKTEQMIKQYQMKIDTNNNGFKCYANTKFSLTEFINYIKQTTDITYFDFEISTSNSKFYFFTDFPINWTGQVLYNSHSISDISEEDGMELKGTLSKNENTTSLANLKIYFDDLLKFKETGSGIQYKVNFQSRSTQWQYYIINKSAISFKEPVISGKSEIQFEAPKNVTIQNGQEALLFSSGDTLIPLSQIPKYKFDLINSKSLSNNSIKPTTYKPIFSGLPNPDPARIGIEVMNDKNLVTSPMYVYV